MMMRPAYGDGAPVAAIATALAESALAVVRTSGPGAVEAAARAFSRPRALLAAPGNTLVHGWMLDAQGARVDEVMAAVFRAPKSYTGEDCVEFSCHGGVAAVSAVHAALLAAGFRAALPGEFSFRAFLNGKLDLTRAESVMELVGAKTDAARGRALGRLSGALEREIDGIKRDLVGALAATELLLDYSEDDGAEEEVPGALPERAAVEGALGALRRLADGWAVERLYRDGATVAVAGRPNAGKSSLFNRLAKEERSIVSPAPGTTRDYIEAWVSIEGIPVRLVDTAGLRDSADPVESAGVERSRALADGADLVLYLVDGSVGSVPEDDAFISGRGGKPVILAWNKIDARDCRPAPPGALSLSAADGRGIPELAEALAEALRAGRAATENGGGSSASASAGLGSARQKELVDRAAASVAEALRRSDAGLPLDLAAPELREAVDALGEITGEVSTADLLETMFGRFCVGK